MAADNENEKNINQVQDFVTQDNPVVIEGDEVQEQVKGSSETNKKSNTSIPKAKPSKKSTNFPTPTEIEKYQSYGFGSFKNAGGMYIYVNGPYRTISLSQSKYLNSTVEIDNQSKTRKKSLLLAISSVRSNNSDLESIKYIKIAFEYESSDEAKLNKNASRVLIVQRFASTTEDKSNESSIGILVKLSKFLEIKDFIYSPGMRSLAVEDDEVVDF